MFTEGSVEAFRVFAAAVDLFGVAPIMHFTRVMGSSLARIAEAAVSMFLAGVEDPLRKSGGSELDLAQNNVAAIELFLGVLPVMDYLLRLHMMEAIDRARLSRTDAGGATELTLAIGFVDLVGSTAIGNRLDRADFIAMVTGFEARAYDLVASFGGRLVKLIGDEVMFVSLNAADGCEIALGLCEAFDRRFATPRGGVAYGTMLAHGGDYYGPTVNLASRVAEVAVPGEVLVTQAVAGQVEGRLACDRAGRRMLKGFDEPVELFSLARL
jgi:adenylate cyclase